MQPYHKVHPAIGDQFASFEKKFHIAICISIVVIGIIFAIVPDSLLSSSTIGKFVGWVRFYWPKMDSDAQYIGSYDMSRGLKYVLVNVFSTIFFVLLALGSIWVSRKQVLQSKQFPNFVKRSNLIFFPLLLALLFYLMAFDEWIVPSDSRVARGMFRTISCLFWPPLVLGTIAIGLFRTFGTYSAWFQGKLP